MAINRSNRWLQGAKRALEDERWDDVVYASQMATEHSVKAILIALGIEYPKVHDVSGIFRPLEGREDLPEWFREMIPEIADSLSELSEERAPAGYGFEMGVEAEDFKEYAPEALGKAKTANSVCEKLLNEIFS